MSKKVRIRLTETAVMHYDFDAEISDSDFEIIKGSDNVNIDKWIIPDLIWKPETLNPKFAVLEDVLDSISPDSNVVVGEKFLNVTVTYNETSN